MKKLLFSLLVAVFVATSLFASDIQVDGIWYDFDDVKLTASVTYKGSSYDNYSNEYTGSVVIPTSITYYNKIYSVTTIGDGAFERCSGLTSVTIPNSVTTIGNSAFYGCSGLTSVTLNSNAICSETYTYYSNIGSLFGSQVKEYIIGTSVTAIGNSAFYGCYGLTSVTIPNSVTTIGNEAFKDCRELTSIEIPNSVATIGIEAFYHCTGFTSVTIPSSVTTIGYKAFFAVNNIIYSGTASGSPWGAKCINGYVEDDLVYSDITKTTLCGCSSAATGAITIPSSVQTIKSGTFLYCSGLTSVTIPNSVTTIGNEAFCYCTGLTSIIIPNSVTTIGDNAFKDVNNIVYSGTATGSPWGAKCMNGYVDGYWVYSDSTKTTLCGCSSAAIGEIDIPNSVTTIRRDAFNGCSGLTKTNYTGTIADWCKIKFENFYSNPNSYSHHFCINDVEIINLVIPQSVTTIRDYAFTCCDGLTSLTIPSSVTMIGQEAFFNCSNLASVTIGSSVSTIGEWAFEYCMGLTSMTCYATTPPTCRSYCFNLVDTSIPVYVPAQSVEAYKQAEEWKDFTNIQLIAAEEVPVTEPVATPDSHSVTITWPQTDNADTYTLEIRKNSELVCTLTFNNQGIMTNITFAAPARGGKRTASEAEMTINGYKFTVTGLEPGTEYTYTITAKNTSAQPIKTYSGKFTTTGTTGLENLTIDKKVGNKFIYGNQLYLRRGDKIYNAAGVLVK